MKVATAFDKDSKVTVKAEYRNRSSASGRKQGYFSKGRVEVSRLTPEPSPESKNKL